MITVINTKNGLTKEEEKKQCCYNCKHCSHIKDTVGYCNKQNIKVTSIYYDNSCKEHEFLKLTQCRECNKYFRSINKHISTHKLTSNEYKNKYNINKKVYYTKSGLYKEEDENNCCYNCSHCFGINHYKGNCGYKNIEINKIYNPTPCSKHNRTNLFYCMECGKYFRNLNTHILTHNITYKEYKDKYRINNTKKISTKKSGLQKKELNLKCCYSCEQCSNINGTIAYCNKHKVEVDLIYEFHLCSDYKSMELVYCKECKKYYRSLSKHVTKHNMTLKDYNKKYKINQKRKKRSRKSGLNEDEQDIQCCYNCKNCTKPTSDKTGFCTHNNKKINSIYDINSCSNYIYMELICCEECGMYFRSLDKHVSRTHKLSLYEYKEKHGFNRTTPCICEELQKRSREYGKRLQFIHGQYSEYIKRNCLGKTWTVRAEGRLNQEIEFQRRGGYSYIRQLIEKSVNARRGKPFSKEHKRKIIESRNQTLSEKKRQHI